jgi:two-component system nitrate/nitrite response regulator NarL
MAENASPVRIVLLDDHELFREGLARLINSETGLQLVGNCGSIPEAIKVLSEQQVDLILLDLDLGDEEGIDLLRRLPSLDYKGRILVITGGLTDFYVRELLSLKVSGIFLKHKSPALLMQSIRHVMAGGTWIDQQHLRTVFESSNDSEVQHKPFTSRENEVLRLVVQGLQNKEIAAKLNISESAAKATMQQLFHKTGVRTRSQLVRVALERYRDAAELWTK